MPAAATGHPAVVLVGDNPDVLGMYEAGLSMAGFTAYTAAPTLNFAETFHAVKADAIVTLLPCAEISGLDLIERLRTDDTDSIPVVVITDQDNPETRARAESLGCAAVLVIPCLPDHLTHVLRRVLFVGQAR